MRINLFAGGGAGKSTTAEGVSHTLKKNGHSVDLVREYIKGWAYQGRVPKSFDQLYILGKQLHAEDFLFQSGVEHIVTDSPVMLSAFYGRKYGFCGWEELLSLAQHFEKQHPSINIFLSREGIPFKNHGRFGGEKEALDADVEMRDFLDNVSKVEYVVIPTVKLDEIVKHVLDRIVLDKMSREWVYG